MTPSVQHVMQWVTPENGTTSKPKSEARAIAASSTQTSSDAQNFKNTFRPAP